MISVSGELNGKVSKFTFENVKDIILLSFGSFGLCFMLSVYIVKISRIFVENNFALSVGIPTLFSEVLFLVIFAPFFAYMYGITRTKIGRRTPYLLTFGVLSSFFMALVEKIGVKSLFEATLSVLLLNFALFSYTLAFVGLLKDESTYYVKDILIFQVRLWGFIGTFLGFTYLIKYNYTGNEMIVASFVFIISVIVVSLFVVEDKKYKVKMLKSEKPESNYRLSMLFRHFVMTKKDVERALVFSLIAVQETFIIYFLKDFPFRHSVYALILFMAGTISYYTIYIFSKKLRDTMTKSWLEIFSILLVALFYTLFYTLHQYKAINAIVGIQFIVGTLFGIVIEKYLGFVIPGRCEWFIIYSHLTENDTLKFDVKKLQFLLFSFILIIAFAVIFDFVGSKNVSLIYASFLISLLLLRINKT
ncbi:MAG: hypothetical protein ACP5PP_01835 [Fervidobacterium sp.]